MEVDGVCDCCGEPAAAVYRWSDPATGAVLATRRYCEDHDPESEGQQRSAFVREVGWWPHEG